MLIGLHGKARSGKDQSYEYIEAWARYEGRPVRRDAFADRLKLSAARIFFPEIELKEAVAWCNALKEHGRVGVQIPGDGDHALAGEISGRVLLQRYGTEAHRQVFHNDFWIHALFNDYSGREFLVITDVRFTNEADAIHELNGEVWHIKRPTHGYIAEDGHASEVPLPDSLIDRTIVNDGSRNHLRNLIHTELESVVYG